MILISIPTPGVWMPSTIFLTLAIAGLIACWLPARRHSVFDRRRR